MNEDALIIFLEVEIKINRSEYHWYMECRLVHDVVPAHGLQSRIPWSVEREQMTTEVHAILVVQVKVSTTNVVASDLQMFTQTNLLIQIMNRKTKMMNLLVYFINDHQIIFIFTLWKYQRLCIWFKTEEKIAMKPFTCIQLLLISTFQDHYKVIYNVALL